MQLVSYAIDEEVEEGRRRTVRLASLVTHSEDEMGCEGKMGTNWMEGKRVKGGRKEGGRREEEEEGEELGGSGGGSGRKEEVEEKEVERAGRGERKE